MLLVRDRKHTADEKAFLDRGYTYLLNRKLFRSLRNNGKIMDEDFLKIIFRRFYEYDILRGLVFISKYCSAFQIPFPNSELEEALQILARHINSDGSVVLSRKYWNK